MRRLAVLLAVGVLAWAPDGKGLEAAVVRFVDDRGDPVESTLRVCRTEALDQTCEDVTVDGSPVAIESFESLQVSGPEHGPSRYRRRPVDGVLVLPRKAFLNIESTHPATRFVASLYATSDQGLRRPSERFEVSPASPSTTLRFPAGSWLLSLADDESAPDLHLLTAGPAERREVVYRRRPGWSAVVRVVEEATGEPVANAHTRLSPTPGYGDAGPRHAMTGSEGLVALSGIISELADVAVSHQRFLPATAAALSASPGSFAVRQVKLPIGGHVEAQVRLDGKPAAGAGWALRQPGGRGEGRWEQVLSGETDDEGRFHAGPARPGLLSLLVTPADPDSKAHAITDVRVVDGETRQIEVDLVRRVVEGEVRRGSEPATGYGVSIASETTGASTHREWVAATEVDEDGRYRLVVWKEGDHTLTLADADGRFVETDRVWVDLDGARRDFDLSMQTLSGRAVDPTGRGLPDAKVLVEWNRRHFTAEVDEEGRFEVPLNGSGTAEVGGYLEGQPTPEPVRVDVRAGESPPPVTLRFETRTGLTGTVFAQGRPHPGVRVSVYATGAGEMPDRVGLDVTDSDGGFGVSRRVHEPLQFFLSGPGCPLTLVTDSMQEERPLELHCAPTGGNLLLHLQDREDVPYTGESLTLARSGVAVPAEVLSRHLTSLGLLSRTDGDGAIVLAALEPGRWEVFLAQGSNAATIRSGRPFGFLTAADVEPRETVELDVVSQR